MGASWSARAGERASLRSFGRRGGCRCRGSRLMRLQLGEIRVRRCRATTNLRLKLKRSYSNVMLSWELGRIRMVMMILRVVPLVYKIRVLEAPLTLIRFWKRDKKWNHKKSQKSHSL